MPTAARGWERARLAFATISHHEIALLLLGAGVVVATWDQPNRTGLWTFVVLWIMRQSAKLNVFLGVRNLSEEFLPAHLRYLQTYFTRRPMNALWPVVVTLATCAVVPIWSAAAAAGAGSYAFASNALIATLLSLAIVEHLFFVVPLPFTALWKWGMRSHARTRLEATAESHLP